MAYDLNHWNNPRASIATKYNNNDFAYVTRGAMIAFEVMRRFDIKPSEAKEMTILDYGCGTGRAAMFLSFWFKQSIGFDPNRHCIVEANKENQKSDVNPKNLLLTSTFSDVPTCDIAFSTNVIEHLNEHDQNVMIRNLKKGVIGDTLLWYAPTNNPTLEPYILTAEWKDRLSVAKNAAIYGGGKIQIDMFNFNLS